MSGLAFDSTIGLYFRQDPPTGFNYVLQSLEGQPSVLLKTIEIATHWIKFFSALSGNDSATLTSSKFASAVNLGRKSIAFSGFLGTLAKVGADFNKVIELVNSNKKPSEEEVNSVATSGLNNTITLILKVGEINSFLRETGVIPETRQDALSKTMHALSVINALGGVVDSAGNIYQFLTKNPSREVDKEVELEVQIYESKMHESWLGMLKNISSLALSILSFVGVFFGVGFADPILLTIGTVVLVTSIALSFIRDNRKVLEDRKLIGEVNLRLKPNGGGSFDEFSPLSITDQGSKNPISPIQDLQELAGSDLNTDLPQDQN